MFLIFTVVLNVLQNSTYRNYYNGEVALVLACRVLAITLSLSDQPIWVYTKWS